MVKQQPMKMAAAEALFDTQGPAPFSLFATGELDAEPAAHERRRADPDLLSLLATGHLDGDVKGINDLNARVSAALRRGPSTRRSSASPTGRSAR